MRYNNKIVAQIFYFLGHEQFQPEILVEHAALAEQAGFDGVMVSEHFHPWVVDSGASGFALATLGAIAVKTNKIKLITGVISPLFRYHPAVIAQAAATIDRLSNGRFTLGLGAGESINEAPLGFSFPGYKERSQRIREAIAIISGLLNGNKIDFSGNFYTTSHAKLYSPPYHRVPIFLAAGGTKSGILAGEITDGLIVSVKKTEETLEAIIKPAQQKAREEKKENFPIVASRWSVFAKDEHEAWEAVKPWRGLRAPHRDTAVDPQELQNEADALPKQEILARYSILASVEDYVSAYSPLIETLHADIVVIQTTGVNQKQIIDLLGKEVVPELKKLK